MLNPAVIGRLSDGYIQPMNDWILASVLGRPSSSVNTDDKFEYMLEHPVGTYANTELYGVLPVRWVSAACCPLLTRLDLAINKMSVLYLSGSTALSILYIIDNPCLKRLDVSTNTAITYLGCYNNSLETLILSPSKASYYLFDCHNNYLTSLDLSGSTGASEIRCYDNELTLLNVTGSSVVQLTCQNNKLPSLNTVGCISMWYLDCSNNELTSLTGSEALQYLDCSNNKLKSLDVKSLCTGLTSLNCSYNNLGSLDVSTNPNASSINCSNNPSLISIFSPGSASYLDASNCNLSQDADGGVNYILTDFVVRAAAGGGYGLAGTLDISGGTNAVPTNGTKYAGLTASASLASMPGSSWVIKRNY